MTIELLHSTPLWVASKAIRKCWASEDKSDTIIHYETDRFDAGDKVECGQHTNFYMGSKDKELIHRVGNKNKHASTLEHLNYTFDIDGISRACLQEVARHRHASISVKSTRYTLKELKDAPLDGTVDFRKFVVSTHKNNIDEFILKELSGLKDALEKGVSNDIAKYMLPEAYKTSLVWTINARSLQNFLSLRTNKAALWEIRELAYQLYNRLPEEHKYLFFDSLYQEEK
jgi:thymidylate synthase (FAD)